MKNLLSIFFRSKSGSEELGKKILAIVADITEEVAPISQEKIQMDWYGAYDINPKHLVIWICLKSDKTKLDLSSNESLKSRFKDILKQHQYPAEAIDSVHIGFESQETVDRESKGNWYHHFK